MSFRPSQKEPKPTKQAKRYRAGQVPENYNDDLSDSSSEEEEQQEQQQQQREVRKRVGELQFAQKEVNTGIQQVAISDKDASDDRRLRRLQQAQQQAGRRRRDESDDESDDEQEEEERARERMRLKQKSIQQQQAEEGVQEASHTIKQESIRPLEESEEEEEEESKEEEGSSEYESSSEEEDTVMRLPKPVFIPKARRETILEQEKMAKEAEEREKRLEEEMEERKKQSHDMLAEELKREREQDLEKDLTQFEDAVDDTDGLDEEAEFNAWRVRELMRIKRDREERIAREKEEEELERIRSLPEDVRLKEDLKRAEESKQKDRGQFTYMQKYYHKGAFYVDEEDEIFKRDYSAPTIDEVRNKDLLPKVMQVKNFGLAGRTKYTHLVDQDTSSKDSPWDKPLAKRRRKNEDV
ncbi:splicing factor, Prp19-binding domain-containing protein [Blakeslea trispora]|nr:splicing factor, Prp19-binding domain-containing protein [Blakeslea trispora]